jgi:glucose/arabinose dehydrogenase
LRRALAVAGLALLLGAGCVPKSTNPNASPSPWPAAVATPDDNATPGPAIVKVEHVTSFDGAISMRAMSGDVLYVVTKTGKFWRYSGGQKKLLLDLTDEVSNIAEEGLLDFVVSPDRQYAYFSFTGLEKPYGSFHVREYRWTGSEVTGDPREVLVVKHPYPHHNAGQLQFGPDGDLYVAIGDGGTANLKQEPRNGDPHGYGQGTNELLGNVLRIRPRPGNGKQYTIPKDNPFVGKPGRDEIWAYGLRNPWRFSFDRQTDDLWLPDVGHQFWEEINYQKAGTAGGANFGWSRLEAALKYKGEPPAGNVLPVYAYPHRNAACAVIGGYVYRGSKIPELSGSYVFGDLCTGQLQTIKLRRGAVVSRRFLGVKVENLVAFAEDPAGELYVVSLSKGVYRILPGG